ncbi:hypothetical protein FNV43_RR04485 [Rhamnella rubrinervis]|uniref:Uncharacterized protein n=1 Tax=Rhamnella rubrinervis TaxID=2594499 RepID=A0A8K0HL43_9ROSA|nr:hypothetical protein FNV43_RR04485 [Rhamnella rubrinervis]
MGSNIPLQQPSFLANNSVGVNNGSNLEFTSNITASPSYSYDHLPSQFQPALGIGQFSLNRSAAEYRRSSVLSHAFRPQGTGYYIVHTQAFPLPDNVHGIGLERSQFSNSFPTRDLSSFLNLNHHPAVPINLTPAEFRSNGDVAHAPVSSIPGACNPNFVWDQAGTGLQTDVAESSFQLSNPLLHHQPANEHSRLEDRANIVTSSTSRMMNSDANMLPPTRSPFPPMSLNNLNRGGGNINSSDGTSNRRMNPLMAPETSVVRNLPTDLTQMRSSSAVGMVTNDNHGKEVMTSEQASLENNAPNQAQPAADVARKDKLPLIFRSVKEE